MACQRHDPGTIDAYCLMNNHFHLVLETRVRFLFPFAPELNLTAASRRLSFKTKIMADIPPTNPLPGMPTGAEPMKKSTGKVQPKKETVRINLPPKPTAAPTIKLPTLPPGGPTGAPSPAIAPMPSAAPAPAKIASPAAAPVAKGAAGGSTAQQRPAPVQRAAAPAVASIKTFDKVLIFSAAVASLAAVGCVVWVYLTLKNTVETFTS